jgi:peptidoglycan/LPS O-acetylase OafA/YrhL
MDQDNLQPTEKILTQATAGTTSRLFFIDHLRAALVILVVLHHVAAVYGASTPFYYTEPPLSDLLAFQALLVFMLVNQGWFMGAFFLLAGYFTPGSYNRKGSGSFLKDRLLRLGIPLILFIYVLSPISFLGLWKMPAIFGGIETPLTWQSYWQIYPNFIGLGPLWFVAMLFIFSIGYAAWRGLLRKRTTSSMDGSSPISYLRIGIFILALAFVNYLLRIVIPIGKEVSLFSDILSFPTLGYLPQYLSFFILGTIASRHDWFRTLPGSMGVVSLLCALVAGIFLFPLAFSGKLLSLQVGPALGNALGNAHWQSAVYALWDSITAVGLCLGLITVFRRFLNEENRFGRFLSQHGYTVYLIHIPLIVLLAIALRGLDLPNLIKFGVATVIVVPTCFIVAFIVRKIPGVARIL